MWLSLPFTFCTDELRRSDGRGCWNRPQLAGAAGEDAAAVLGDDDGVLDLESGEAELVVRRLDLEDHARLERRLRRLVEDRRVVGVETDAVADVVPAVVRDPGLARRLDRRGEHVLRRHAGPHRVDRGLLAREDRVVVALQLLG